MEVQQQLYQGEDSKRQMLALVHACPEEHLHVVDLPYRLSSGAFDVPENVGLWTDGTAKLVAWAVLQTPFWAIDYACHPDAPPAMHQRALAWATLRAEATRSAPSGHPMWFVNVFARQADRIRDLEEAGFADQADVGENSWSKVFLRRTASEAVPMLDLPAGFTLRPLAGASEVTAQVRLHRAAFESESMTEAWRGRILERPEYRPELDLVAVAPDGQLAASCLFWFDPAGRGGQPGGQVEPLGVDPAFRGHGLGRALLWEGFRRLHALGAEHIFVETDRHRNAALGLYESVDFRVIEEVLVYRKDFPG